MLYDLVGNFLSNSTYSESMSLSPDLATGVKSLSGSASILGVLVRLSVDCTRFRFILPILMADGVALSGSAVPVGMWATIR